MGREELIELLEPTVVALGYELVDLTYGSGRRKLLRLYIGKPEGAISIDDCVRVSRAVDVVLDEADPIPGPYTLEVSSPGKRRRGGKGPAADRTSGH